MRMKKMNKKRENIIGMLVIRVFLCSHPIDCKKKILISHILRGNWNFRFLIV